MDVRKVKPQYSLQFSQLLKLFLLGTLIFSSVFFLNRFNLSHYFPIKTVRVYGVNHIDRMEVQNLLLPLVQRGFFTISVESIKDRLIQQPWVSDIFVRRTWPDQVEVTVVERNPIARWNDGSLLSTTGELFSPRAETYPVDLPQFIGPEGDQIVMLRYFNEISRVLMPLHAKISYLEMTPYFTWKLKLDNGMMLKIGHKDILTRLDHFVRVYPKIVGAHATDVDYIDLRYSNGMAVRWKKPLTFNAG